MPIVTQMLPTGTRGLPARLETADPVSTVASRCPVNVDAASVRSTPGAPDGSLHRLNLLGGQHTDEVRRFPAPRPERYIPDPREARRAAIRTWESPSLQTRCSRHLIRPDSASMSHGSSVVLCATPLGVKVRTPPASALSPETHSPVDRRATSRSVALVITSLASAR